MRRIADQRVRVQRDHVRQDAVETWSVVACARLAERGSPIVGSGSLFDRAFFEAGAGEVTAFVVVDDAAATGAVTLDGGTFAVAEHTGPYADLDLTYGALGARVAADLPAGAGPIREHYVVGPGDVTDAADYRTEVLWPLAV